MRHDPAFALRRISPSLMVLAILGTASFPDALAAADKQPAADLPLSKVVMFTSGVGYFEHKGNVKNDAAVELKFNSSDINDLLKSLVLEDQGGGHISTVTYGSKDPITKTLQTFAIDLTSNPTLGQILNQVRGEAVKVNAPNEITGVILGVEPRRKEVGPNLPPVEYEVLNLLTDDGMRGVSLDSVGHVKLVNEKLDAELRQALKTLAMSHSTDKKSVTLNFQGAGERPVRVGYIQETPIWQTSYRLVLADKEPPFLQGWAIVENTTEQDWNKVDLTLISGRPISFVMDLYQPLYIQRPVVEPELYASLKPQKYGQNLDEDSFAEASGPPAAREKQMRKSVMAAAAAPAAAPMAFGMAGERGLADATRRQESLQLNRGVQSAAQGGDVGELFQYVIATPVTLPRQQSAMLPIVNESVKGEKVSIYNQSVEAKHPLSGLRLKNATELHLMQGPITVFDAGAYAGDARIEDLPPGGERLISYAIDLDTEVAPEVKSQPQLLVQVRLAKGVLMADYRYARETHYTIKNGGKHAKTVLVETPLEAGWSLVTPKEPSEKTRDLYRFAVTAEPKKPAKLEVREERTMRQDMALTNLDDNAINFYISQPVVSDAVKAAMKEVVARKVAIQQVVERRQTLDKQIGVIDSEQSRIRQNMNQLDHNSDLYKKYVTKFSNQEDEVEKLRAEIKTLTAEEGKLRQSLDHYLLGLDLK